jgi:hypothetical protein
MDSLYDDYYNHALNLQNHFHDVVDNHSHPQMQSLQNELHGLTEDLKSRRRPRSVEERLKIIDHQLLQAREHGEQLISYQDIENLQHQTHQLRENVRKLPDY